MVEACARGLSGHLTTRPEFREAAAAADGHDLASNARPATSGPLARRTGRAFLPARPRMHPGNQQKAGHTKASTYDQLGHRRPSSTADSSGPIARCTRARKAWKSWAKNCGRGRLAAQAHGREPKHTRTPTYPPTRPPTHFTRCVTSRIADARLPTGPPAQALSNL